MSKPRKRKNKILMINAVNEVTRERAQSFLTDEHIGKILKAYVDGIEMEGFSRLVTRTEVREQKDNLSISLYVRPNEKGDTESVRGECLAEELETWRSGSDMLRTSMMHMVRQVEDANYDS